MASTKRERELARMRAQRQAARRAALEAERRKRRATVLAGLSALAVAAVIVGIAVLTGGDDDDALSADPGASASATSSTAAGACSYSTAGQAAKPVSGLPSTKGPATKSDTKVVLTTSRGEVDLTLRGAKAPCTTNSFTFLAGQKYFDGTSCHRLTTAGIFVLQCGDPTGSGSGGPGYQFADENLTGLGAPNTGGQVIYPRGTVAMANGGPGTNGSQFFLVYKDSPLAPKYTPFGTITKGLDVLDAIAKGGSTPVNDGKPNLAITITTAKVQG
ncbi:MAG TPA: peptidylprolyl isomerase, partial [Mycobacteriales bacterium]|nr:peptidylprolyl isomerase [Mycobacteriales bacterium]